MAGALALCSAAGAEMAVSEGFEGFAPGPGESVSIPNGHRSLNWPGFEVFDGTFFPEGSQFRAGIVSGENVAHVRSQGRINSEQPFTVRSFWLTGEANVPSIFTLWRGETRIWFSRVVPADARPLRVSFAEFEDVTRMEIQAYGSGIVVDEMQLAIQPPTETITFEDISATAITNGYWRLRWDGFEAVDATMRPQDSLEGRALKSGRNVAVLRRARSSIRCGNSFNLRSLWLTAQTSATVTITAAGVSRRVGIGAQPTFVELLWNGVTEVTFDAPPGQIAVDDIEAAIAPLNYAVDHPLFEAGPVFYPASLGSPVVSADFNGDGRNDLAMSGLIELGAGEGRFQIQPGSDRAGSPITTGDYTGDGRADVITHAYADGYYSYYIAFDETGAMRNIQMSYGSGTVAFGAFNGSRWVHVNASETATADFNRDGGLDYVAAGPNSITVFYAGSAGQFFQSQPLGIESPRHSMLSLDYDGDGDLDLVTAYPNRDALGILINSRGTITRPVFVAVGIQRPKNLALSDMDGDGIADLIVRSSLSEVAILHGLRAGGFAPAVRIISPLAEEESVYVTGNLLAVNDLSSDGTPDIAFLRGTEIAIIYNKTPPRLRISRVGDLPEIRWLDEFGKGAILETARSIDGEWETHRFPPQLIGQDRGRV